MFKEILHYTFRRSGFAFDLSAFDQHGHPSGVGFSQDGAARNSGAVVFNGQSGRVSVPFGEVWQELGAIEVEALVRLDELGMRHNLVEGFLSLALFVRADGVVTGSFLAPKQTGSPFAASSSLAGIVSWRWASPPDAPVRLSTTRRIGKIGCAALATVRATTSVPPPAE